MILTFLTKYRDFGLLLVRLGIGLAMALHGWPKLIAGPQTWAGIGAAMGNLGITLFPAFWGFMAAITEFAGGILLALGLAFRPACLFLLANMLVAVLFHVKKGDTFNAGWSHAFELAVVFLSLLFIGPGKYSVDKQ